MSEWAEPRHEPPLAEILAEPIIRALMACDRVEHEDIIELLARAASRVREPARVAA
jgi:hypothetical protein